MEEEEDGDVKMEDVKEEDAQTESAPEDSESEDVKDEEEEETKVPAKRSKSSTYRSVKHEPTPSPPKGRGKSTRSTRTNKA